MDVIRELEGLAFGLTDGVICFLGILIGVAAATNSSTTVIIAGIVGGIANSFGNAIGFYISQAMERGIQTYEKREKKIQIHVHSQKEVTLNAVLSFLGTLSVMIVLITPFFYLDLETAMKVSFAFGILILFGLGVYVGKLMRDGLLKTGVQFAIMGTFGALLGYLVGVWVRGMYG